MIIWTSSAAAFQTPLETARRCPAESAARLLACANLSPLFPVVASEHQLVHHLLAGWRGEP